jgi:hypothetical protein
VRHNVLLGSGSCSGSCDGAPPPQPLRIVAPFRAKLIREMVASGRRLLQCTVLRSSVTARPWTRQDFWQTLSLYSAKAIHARRMSFSLTRRAAVQSISASRAFSTSVARPVARITIVGHLGDTPEVQVTSTGHEVVKYAVATNSGPKDNRKTSWFRIASFEPDGPRRELLRSLPKG